MPHEISPREIPLERYRALMGSLAAERELFEDRFWMRFAAQAAVSSPGDPEAVAAQIRTVALGLQRHSRWYQTLATGSRFVVAAMLVQHAIPVEEFVVEHARVGGLLHQVGLRHSGFHATMAILITRLSILSRPINLFDMKRIELIYQQMKALHWWLTGPDDLPACAALAQCPGTPEVIVACAENAYQQLHGAGLGRGEHLQTAANLLPLAGISIDRAVSRYLALQLKLEEAIGAPLQKSDYDAVAVLTFLDHPPERVVNNLVAVRKELDLFQEDLLGSGNLLIATDLCFMDLVRFDQDLLPLTEARQHEALDHAIHAFHLASAVMVSQAEPPPPLVAPPYPSMGWPYAPS